MHMADPSHQDSNDSAAGTDDSDAGTPRWVKVFGIVTIVLVLVFVILHLTGRGLGGHTL
jgi:hypothetical protein